MQQLTRSQFVRSAAIGAAAAGLVFAPATLLAEVQKKRKKKGPQIPTEKVEEFVTVAHSKLDRVKALLEEYPKLINAAWDWGGGDFETALGAAAHTGHADIAEYLLSHDARLDVFAAAMLGKLEVVKAVVAAFPNTPNVPGPHGIPLIAHARKGGKPAEAVAAFLESLG